MEHIFRIILKNDRPDAPDFRRRCGVLSGRVGIALNLLLFAAKVFAGILSSSVAMVADAVNNLSDAGSSLITLAGFRLSALEADARHPFGHGRIEYVAGLVVSLAILVMGLEVGKSAVIALFRPEDTVFSLPAVGILCASVLVKLLLYRFNRFLGGKIGSAAMEATAADSLSDALATGVVLLSALADHFFGLRLDGAAGLLVACFILKAGWEAFRDTVDPLLGRPMDPELASDVDRIAVSHENILGIHDLVYHDYGPGRAMMSFHAEVPADGDFLQLHALIDHIERELQDRHHIMTVIHMDPVVRDEHTESLRQKTAELAASIHAGLTIHDFRLVPGGGRTMLFFDLSVPYGLPLTPEEAGAQLEEKLQALDPALVPVIQAERPFVQTTV